MKFGLNTIVITTINPISRGIRRCLELNNWNTIVVGDKKSVPIDLCEENSLTLPLEDQIRLLNYASVKTTPINHYSRKNLGYIYAIRYSAGTLTKIYETDDDTFLRENIWIDTALPSANWILYNEEGGSVNAYTHFTNYYMEDKIWPRGLPLESIDKQTVVLDEAINNVGVWQGVIHGDTDVDAIYRIANGKLIEFEDAEPVAIRKYTYCPFNTQNTLWFKQFFPLMYLPITVEFRFTDILRGYIAQRIMWDYDACLGYCYTDAFQERNAHNNVKDFYDEISMYKNVPSLLKILDEIDLSGYDIYHKLLKVYETLAKNNIVQQEELVSVSNWIEDIKYG